MFIIFVVHTSLEMYAICATLSATNVHQRTCSDCIRAKYFSLYLSR